MYVITYSLYDSCLGHLSSSLKSYLISNLLSMYGLNHIFSILSDHNSSLEIKSATYTRDTGAYKCKAKNAAGQAQDIATVFIENSKAPKYSSK